MSQPITALFADLPENLLDEPTPVPMIDPAFGEAPVTITHEKAIHRTMAYMRCSGATLQKIADLTGYSLTQVQKVCRQIWFRQLCAEIIRDEFSGSISHLLEAAATESILTIINIRDQSSNDKVRLDASIHLLDRHLGKAPTHTHHHSETKDPSEEFDNITRELKGLQERQKPILS